MHAIGDRVQSAHGAMGTVVKLATSDDFKDNLCEVLDGNYYQIQWDHAEGLDQSFTHQELLKEANRGN